MEGENPVSLYLYTFSPDLELADLPALKAIIRLKFPFVKVPTKPSRKRPVCRNPVLWGEATKA
jgi:hypothetical protein